MAASSGAYDTVKPFIKKLYNMDMVNRTRPPPR